MIYLRRMRVSSRRAGLAKRKSSAAKKTLKDKTPAQPFSRREVARVFDACVLRGNAALRPVAAELRRLVKKVVPGSRESINPWGIPSFDFHGPFCFLMVGKNHVTFGFTRGTSLTDAGGLLEGTGKNLRHVKVKEIAQVRDPNLRQLILQAAALNRKTPLTPSMRVKQAI
jgi:hypothetical protein